MSRGEELIQKILSNSKINYIREKTFEDLRHGKFRYDFYCPNINGRQVIIEVNGEQHYRQVLKFQKTRQDFLKQQEHDRRKISYALSHDILIYCIPYWEFGQIQQIDDILNTKFCAKDRWHNDYSWKEHIN